MAAKFRKEIIDKVVAEKNVAAGFNKRSDCYRMDIEGVPYFVFICPTGVYLDTENYGYTASEVIGDWADWIPREIRKATHEVTQQWADENREIASAGVFGRAERIFVQKKYLNRAKKFTGNASFFMSADHCDFNAQGEYYTGLLVTKNLPDHMVILCPVKPLGT